jgi:nucleoside-diphosphate-sugar epimerase
VNFIVLGHTGFIGSPLFARLVGEEYKVLGLNSSQVLLSNHYKIQIKPRTDSNIFEEIRDYIANETVIINCIWGDLTHEKINSDSHQMYMNLELDLINSLSAINFKSYISFGTIHELKKSDSILSASSKYVECKKQLIGSLEKTNLPYSWIRLASIFGPNDTKFRIITKILTDNIQNVDTELQFPNQLMNVYHVDNFVDSLLKFISLPITGTFLAISTAWVELIEIKKAIKGLEEPNYVSLSPLSEEVDASRVISVESSSFVNFVQDFNAQHASPNL